MSANLHPVELKLYRFKGESFGDPRALEWPQEHRVDTLTFTEDGKDLIVTSALGRKTGKSLLYRYSLASGKFVDLKGTPEAKYLVTSLTLPPKDPKDTRFVVGARFGAVVLDGWGIPPTTLVDPKLPPSYGNWQSHRAAVRGVAYSPDASRLYSLSGDPGVKGQLKVWDPTSKQLLQHVALPYEPRTVTQSADRRRLAVGDKHGVVWVYSLER